MPIARLGSMLLTAFVSAAPCVAQEIGGSQAPTPVRDLMPASTTKKRIGSINHLPMTSAPDREYVALTAACFAAGAAGRGHADSRPLSARRAAPDERQLGRQPLILGCEVDFPSASTGRFKVVAPASLVGPRWRYSEDVALWSEHSTPGLQATPILIRS